jgi:hypothetical protein
LSPRQQRFEDQPQAQEFFQLRRLTNISARAELHSVGSIPFSIRRTQNNDRDMTAPLAHAHARQYFATGLLGKIKVDNGEVGARGRLIGLRSLDEFDSLLSVLDDNELAFNTMFFKSKAD